jgi:hypothetical protein
VLFKPRGSSSDTTVVLGVRESNLYRLKGQPMRAMANSSRVTEDKEQVAPKVVQTQRESTFRWERGVFQDWSGRCHGLRKPYRMLRSGGF